MSETVKLYKCYKGTCSKCLDEENLYITENEYKELLDAEGKVQCPEGHLECGIQELKPEDLPKPPPDNKKKLILIGGAVVAILILCAGAYGVYWFTKVKTTVETGIGIVDTVSEWAKDTAVTNAVKGVITEAATTGKEGINSFQEETTTMDDNTGDKTGILVSSSIQDYFNKLSDPGIEYSKKEELKSSGILTYFVNGNSTVITLGENKTEVADSPISEFAEVLRTTNYKFTFINGEKNGSSKYSKIYVKAN